MERGRNQEGRNPEGRGTRAGTEGAWRGMEGWGTEPGVHF